MSETVTTSESVKKRLRAFQEKLLDLSKRNRLLNYRPLRASTVHIIDELPAEIFRLATAGSRGFQFLPAAEDAEPETSGDVAESDAAGDASREGEVAREAEGDRDEALLRPQAPRAGQTEGSEDGALAGPPPRGPHDLEASEPIVEAGEDAEPEPVFTREFQPYRPEDVAERHVDYRLQTELDPQRLDRNLLRIYQQATSNLEEQGFNTLFLTLGALEWYEPDAPGKPLLAPVVLVPVELRRKSPRSPFHLYSTEEDPLLNPALAMKLERELAAAPQELPDDAEEWDIVKVLSELSRIVEDQPGWRVVNDIYLGLFSFTKFTMYKDLETHSEHFARSPLIRAICGEGPAEVSEDTFPEAAEIDALLDPESTYQVLDADSSQQEAILAAKRGASLVLEGPPGTGKSQTITNIVAECLAAGKRVLFVSEKMAALEVVYSRLREVGLADFCLEIHSKHASKRRVAEELARTLALAEEWEDEPESRALARVRALRERLNGHVQTLSEPVEPLGLTPFEAFGRSAALQETAEVPAPLPEVSAWTRYRYDDALSRLDHLAGSVEAVSRQFPDLAKHPWRGSRLEELTYQTSVKIRSALDEVLATVGSLEAEIPTLAATAASPSPGTCREARRLAELVDLLIETPHPSAESLKSGAWSGLSDEIDRWIKLCRTYQGLWERLAGRWSGALLEAEPAVLSRELRERRGILRFLQPGWWRLRGRLKDLLERGSRLPGRRALLDDLEKAKEASNSRSALRSAGERGRVLFGPIWQDEESNAENLERFARWMRALHPHLRAGGEALLDLASAGLERPEIAAERSSSLKRRVQAVEEAWALLVEAARIDEEEGLSGPLADQHLEALGERLREMARSVDSLHDWGRHVEASSVCAEAGLDGFLREARKRQVPAEDLVPAFERLFLRTWLDYALSQRSDLRRFSRRDHEQAIRDFRELDLEQLRLARTRLRQKLLGALPDSSWEASGRSELGILQREVRRKRGHRPLRKLFQLIPNALARLKPCFLMSPLSVAQYLDPRSSRFDVVVFDEASQIAPEDALGAISRAAQVIVVGDSRQLPPTTFFQRQELQSPTDPDEDDTTPDLESILDECTAAGFPRRLLRWHYRSRHESLIAFSNEHFYEGRLHTFPSCSRDAGRLGVEFVHLEDGVFDRGKTRSNPVEAERVAGEVVDHFRKHPDLTLGVGTFSQAQQEAILDRLEDLRRHDESLEEFFSPERPEHFFVKNLENIQGDERDVIFISVGYGRDRQGRLHLNFGPLNKDGGERRLNVLMTRARRKLRLFSSLQGSDIEQDRVSSTGARLLKRYLEYAERGAKVLASPRSGWAESVEPTPFEEAVASSLERTGLELRRAVGFSRHRVGLAVVDSESPDEYLLGIDWDGYAYQRSGTARDRDRLRQQVLEGLGWRLHRIWSAEWLRNPESEVQRILDALEEARQGKRAPDVLPLLQELERRSKEMTRGGGRAREGRTPSARERGSRLPAPYALAELEPGGEPDDFEEAAEDIVSRLVRVVEVESPIHRDEAARRVAACWGITRLARGVQRRTAEAIEAARKTGKIEARDDDFLWKPGGDPPVPRIREGDDVPREAELIALEEIAELAALVLEREYRLQREDLISQTARLLGFSRAGSRLRERVGEAIDQLLETERAVEDASGVERKKRADR